MKTVATKGLTGAALDWAVWTAAGGAAAYPRTAGGPAFLKLWNGSRAKHLHPSTDWAQGGPIIDREKLSVGLCHPRPSWATRDTWSAHENRTDERPSRMLYGPTALIAAMRCYVTSKLGPAVNVPEELAP